MRRAARAASRWSCAAAAVFAVCVAPVAARAQPAANACAGSHAGLPMDARAGAGPSARVSSGRAVVGEAARAGRSDARSPSERQPPVDSTPGFFPYLLNVSRAEAWSFFEPRDGGGTPAYAFVGNRATLGVCVAGARIDLHGAFQYAQLIGLPAGAWGPGPLGPGALFFDAARAPQAYQLYFHAMSARVRQIVPGLAIEAGRMEYESDEGTGEAGRLIGGAGWTIFGRASDGVRADYERPGWSAHAAFLMPTQGAFEESANPTITRVQLTAASWAARGVRIFAHRYRDTRLVAERPDNTGRREDRVDIDVQTFGALLSGSVGRLDAHLWGAVQRGDWYGDAHRGFSIVAEARYGWPAARGRPSVSAGFVHASGDSDPRDAAHGTFFPMVPTTRPDLFGATYAQMNLRDLHAGIELQPWAGLSLAASVRHLSLASHLDRWYSGTGATASRGGGFGYSARPSALSTDLGTALQLSARAGIGRYWTVGASAGVVKGGDVVQRQFAGDRLTVLVIESAISMR